MLPFLKDLLEKTYYGNTISQWLFALGLILLSVVLGRVLYWILGHWIKALTRKTKTELDDILVDLMKEPVIGLFIAFGIRYSLDRLTMAEQWSDYLDNALVFAIAFLVTWLAVRIYDAIHEKYLVTLAAKTETDLDDQLLPVLRNGVRFLLFSLGLIVGLNNAGFDVGAVLAGLGIGGLAFALAAQDTVANLFGGITILLQRPFRLQDRISVSGIEGYVVQLGLRTTQLKTISGERVQLPNKFFTANSIHNLDSCDYYYEYESYLLHRNTTIEQVDRILEDLRTLADGHDDVAWSMPIVHQLNEFGYEIRLGYGVNPFNHGEKYFNHYEKIATVKSFLNRRAMDLLAEASIKMAQPAYLSLRRGAPPAD